MFWAKTTWFTPIVLRTHTHPYKHTADSSIVTDGYQAHIQGAPGKSLSVSPWDSCPRGIPRFRPDTGRSMCCGRRAAWHGARRALTWRCDPDGRRNRLSDAVFATSPYPRLDQRARAVRSVALVVVFPSRTSILVVTVYSRVGHWASTGGSARGDSELLQRVITSRRARRLGTIS